MATIRGWYRLRGGKLRCDVGLSASWHAGRLGLTARSGQGDDRQSLEMLLTYGEARLLIEHWTRYMEMYAGSKP